MSNTTTLSRRPKAMNNPTDPERHDERIMTTSEVASWLSVSAGHLNRQAKAGEIPSSFIGGERRFWRPSLLAKLFPLEPAVDHGDEPADVVTPEELAIALRLTPQTVIRRCRDSSIPASKIGSIYRIYWPTIRARLEAGEDFLPPNEQQPE